MRTTIRLDDSLMREAKIRAAEQGITLTQLIDESLRERLSARRPRKKGGPFRLRSFGEGGTRSGVDLSDNRAVRDLMDDDAGLLPPSPGRQE
jgi:hypothetical protein